MSSSDAPTRRKSYRWWRVFIAFILIIGVNYAMFSAWQRYLPELSLFPSATLPDETVEEEEVVVKDIVMSEEIQGQLLASRLLKVFPDPGEGWATSLITGTPMGTVVDTVCPAENPLAPAIQEQLAWRTAGEPVPASSTDTESAGTTRVLYDVDNLNGIVAQVRIYKAGLGAVAMRNLRSQILSCEGDENWDVSWGGDLSIGQESFYYRATGDGASQVNAVFREGDVVGIVSVRGYADAGTLAEEWNSRWAPLLKSICLNVESDLKDALRQPLYKGYEGFVGRKSVSLTDVQIEEIVKQVDAEQRNNLGEEALFIEPSREPGPKENVLTLPPYTAYVDLPEAPTEPQYPEYPKKPSRERDYFVASEDTYGPGCGWALTGQSIPVFDESAVTDSVEKAEGEALRELSSDYAEWVKATWQYSADYAKYVAEANQWNMWVTLVTPAIAKAEWDAYDIAYAGYDVLMKEYMIKKQEYDVCLLINPLPSPTPSPTVEPSGEPSPTPSPTVEPSGEPSPTPSPTGTDAASAAGALMLLTEHRTVVTAEKVCPPKPIPPTPPKEPFYDRPPD